MQMPTLTDLFSNGAHYGHKSELTHPKFKKFIYTLKDEINIIDLEKTQECLKKAEALLIKTVSENKKILFVGTKRQAKEIIKNSAISCDMLYINYRWLGGTVTNFSIIKKRIQKFTELKKILEDKNDKSRTKKERAVIQKEINRMSKFFSGIEKLERIPGVILVVDPNEEHVAVAEAQKANIPVIAICNTNTNITKLNFAIPANDNAPKTIELILGYSATVINEAKNKETSQKTTKEE
jgi:small subunit ribosomal protein S2